MKKILPQWWRNNFLVVELVLAAVITAVFIVWYYASGEACVMALLEGKRAIIYGTFATIFGSLLGFVITATSIVVGFSASDRLSVIRESTQYPILWKVFLATIKSMGLATIVALVGLVLDRDTDPIPILLFIMLFVFILSSLRLVRVIWVLENIIVLIALPLKRSNSHGDR